MRVLKDFNNISKELKDKIIPLLPGQTAYYQVKEFNLVQDPDTGVRTIFYAKNEIWLKDSVYDPGHGRFIDIGIPERIEKEEVVAYKTFKFDNPFDGTVHLSGNKVEDREINEILQLMNLCENSILGEHRNIGIDPIFRRIDKTKEARIKKNKLAHKKNALVYFDMMTLQDKRELWASLNRNHNLVEDELDAEIGDYIDEFAEEFVGLMESVDVKRKATIKFALDEGVIKWDPTSNSIIWGNGSGKVASLDKREGKNHIDLFNEWISTATNGEKVMSQLKKKAKAETA